MEYNNPSELIKNLNFGDEAKAKIIEGVSKLTNAVKSTLGASGMCVIYEDAMGKPVITKDGVTVAESVVLKDPVENIGATLIKEAAKNTVKEAGDGTTTATVLAHSLLMCALEELSEKGNLREIKTGIDSGVEKVIKYLDKIKKEVSEDKLEHVAAISTNNDRALGKIIAEAYKAVGKNGVVLMEESGTEDTEIEIVKGVQFDSSLKTHHLATNEDKDKAELNEPFILISASKISNIRQIQSILEFVVKNNKELLIVAELEQQPMGALLKNKVGGVLKVNFVDTPGFGSTRRDTLEDLAALTGATIVDDELGDALELIDASVLGRAVKSITTNSNTVITIEDAPEDAKTRIDLVKKKIKEESNPFIKTKLEQRLAMLSGAVGIIKVGAKSKVELKEKKDRVEDAIYATKAALKEGIVPGGGVALRDASTILNPANLGESVLFDAIAAPYLTILKNAGIDAQETFKKGRGINVVTGKECSMMSAGVIDPVLVTKTALKNAASVVNTIISADCVISNMRADESN